MPPTPRELIALGVHPASGAWLLRVFDSSTPLTCASCRFRQERGPQAWRGAFCAEPGGTRDSPRVSPWWPACILYESD